MSIELGKPIDHAECTNHNWHIKMMYLNDSKRFASLCICSSQLTHQFKSYLETEHELNKIK